MNKLETYLSFALRKRVLLLGINKAKENINKIKLLIVLDANESNTFRKAIKLFKDNGIDLIYLKREEICNLKIDRLDTASLLAILDSELAGAIKKVCGGV